MVRIVQFTDDTVDAVEDRAVVAELLDERCLHQGSVAARRNEGTDHARSRTDLLLECRYFFRRLWDGSDQEVRALDAVHGRFHVLHLTRSDRDDALVVHPRNQVEHLRGALNLLERLWIVDGSVPNLEEQGDGERGTERGVFLEQLHVRMVARVQVQEVRGDVEIAELPAEQRGDAQDRHQGCEPDAVQRIRQAPHRSTPEAACALPADLGSSMVQIVPAAPTASASGPRVATEANQRSSGNGTTGFQVAPPSLVAKAIPFPTTRPSVDSSVSA